MSGKAEDANGLAPAKNDNAVGHKIGIDCLGFLNGMTIRAAERPNAAP